MNLTEQYYNTNAQEFYQGTVKADMSDNYRAFLNKIPSNGRILDAGCGSGRDTKAFKELGYQVSAIDSSKELCALASKYTGEKVRQIRFQDLDEIHYYDGIWACATLLHVPSKELEDVLKRFYRALKEEGIFYASFKYGDFEGERNGRYFHDLNEDKAKEVFHKVGFKVIKQWTTGDVREGRQDEQWLNILVKKVK